MEYILKTNTKTNEREVICCDDADDALFDIIFDLGEADDWDDNRGNRLLWKDGELVHTQYEDRCFTSYPVDYEILTVSELRERLTEEELAELELEEEVTA